MRRTINKPWFLWTEQINKEEDVDHIIAYFTSRKKEKDNLVIIIYHEMDTQTYVFFFTTIFIFASGHIIWQSSVTQTINYFQDRMDENWI